MSRGAYSLVIALLWIAAATSFVLCVVFAGVSDGLAGVMLVLSLAFAVAACVAWVIKVRTLLEVED